MLIDYDHLFKILTRKNYTEKSIKMDDGSVNPDKMDEKSKLKYVLNNITSKCLIENQNQALEVPLNEPGNRITFYTGLSHTSVIQIINDNLQTTSLDLKSRVLLYVLIKQIYVEHGVLEYDTLYEAVKQHGLYDKTKNLFDFILEMESLGFETKNISNGTHNIIMENPEVRFERYMYLKRINKIRNGVKWKQIVYVDERQLNKEGVVEKTLNTKINLESSNSIFYHAVNKNGYICGLLSNQATHEDFYKWVSDILLGHLPVPCVLVMNNNPLHGVAKRVCSITGYHSKQDMLNWLTKNQIPCTSDMSKPELYELINKINDTSMVYQIDKMIESHGHTVLRLPRSYYDLTLTTPLWKYIIDNYKYDTQMPFQKSLLTFINGLDQKVFIECDSLIKEYENTLFNNDMKIESILDNFTINM